MTVLLLTLTLTACSGDTEPTEPDAPEAPTVEEVEAPTEAPPAEEATADAGDFDAAGFYSTTCQPCHGDGGMGNGPAGAALNPKPASFADASFWDERDDAHVKKVIKEGGASVGKSPIMAPFANSFENDAQVDALIEHLKTFKG